MPGEVERGREAFARRAWAAAFTELTAADRDAGLGIADLERLAVSGYLIGRADDSASAWERAHRACTASGDILGAARCAFWLAFVLLNRGELARGGGWVHRAQRLLGRAGVDGVEVGYLGYVAALRQVMEGDLDGAGAGFGSAARVGDRFGSTELVALARVGQGRCLISGGDTAGGMALLDEAMSMITAAEVSPTAMGDLYCTVIEGCQEVFDVRRAQEWTAALTRWTQSQPELVLYRGQCLVHRAELLMLAGLWSQAVAETLRACDTLSHPRAHPALGSAFYVRAELHRLRGEVAEAEAAYLQASTFGRDPQPGLALLRLREGRVAEALSAIRQALAVTDEPTARAKLLAPLVEVAVAAGDVGAARLAADELSAVAHEWGTPYVSALSDRAVGSVLIAEGAPHSAVAVLRRAWAAWTELGAPHDAALARVLIGSAMRSAGNEQGALMELAAASSELRRLGASCNLLVSGPENATQPDPDGLTAREVEVLRLLATGITNRAIAARLFISEKTVATHVGSILHKLGLPSRAAATAYAHQRHLV